MPDNVTQKLISAHLVDGQMRPGEPISIDIDQTLTQDATGTLVMLALEAIGLDRIRCELSAQYVDHNLLQVDHLNADDHLFLESACRRFGLWYSRAGNGISHVVHMQRFGRPGKSLLGADSHTPAAGALGMLAIGAGGLDVALAMSGEPLRTAMPAVLGVSLTGELPAWVKRQGCHPRDAATPRRRRRCRQGDRIFRPRPELIVRNGQARDCQYGRRARGDHDGVSFRRKDAPLSRGQRPAA